MEGAPVNVSRCDQCGQVDDHPKVHYSDGGTRHHDCLSVDQKAELAASSDKAAAIIAAAESGTHGDELRAQIFDLHKADPAAEAEAIVNTPEA
jgi:recombinational DNA repair protein (RecF pathway)